MLASSERSALSRSPVDPRVQKTAETSAGAASPAPNSVQTRTKGQALDARPRSSVPAITNQRPQPYTLEVAAGTLLYSAIVVHHRLWGHAKRDTTLERITGEAESEPYNPFETRATRISAALLASNESAQALLLQNSVVGFYARGLHESVEAEALRELLRGNRSVVAMYFKSSQQGELASKNLKWCKACAAQDLARDGFAHWYVVHQLPLVTHCHHHFVPLIESCPDCRTRPDNGRRWMLPGDACRCIGKSARSSQPPRPVLAVADPYRQLLEDVDLTFVGRLPQMRPSNWRTCVGSLIRVHGSIERASKALATALMCSWSRSGEPEIAAQVRALVGAGGVERELRLLARPRDLLLRLAIHRARSKDLLPHEPDSSARRTLVDEGADPLVDHLERHGVPAGAASMLRAGEPMPAIESATRTSANVLRRALTNLPKSVSDELAESRKGVRTKQPATPFNLPTKAVTDEQRRKTFRQKIRHLIEVEGLSSRTSITARLGGTPITWMFKNDRAWLEKNLPKKWNEQTKKGR